MASPPRRTIAFSIRSSTLQREDKYRAFLDNLLASINNGLTRTTAPIYCWIATFLLFQNFRILVVGRSRLSVEISPS